MVAAVNFLLRPSSLPWINISSGSFGKKKDESIDVDS